MDSRQRLRDLAINERGFVFDPCSGTSFSVNRTGLFILERLKEGAPAAGLPELIRATFDVGPGEDPARDTRDFLLLLREQGLWSELAAS